MSRDSTRSRWAMAAMLSCIVLSGHALAKDPKVDYAREVAPIFRKHCVACHGPKRQESSFRLDVRATLLRGGDLGEPAVRPGKAGESFLIRAVSGGGDLVMPPKGPRLTAGQIEILKQWIDQGARMPPRAELGAGEIGHWSFQPVRRPRIPVINDPFVASPVDAFILSRLKDHKLTPSRRADRRTLIRRLCLVMHGLPPTPRQVERFLTDDSPAAWRNLIDRVLASPRYGERWARHWLDIVRFGETHGFETNRERPTAWHYRDWVIDALNADKPYDRFILEQIAGDALGEPIGTGFLVAGPHDLVKSPDVNLTLMQRQDELADLINTTGTAFLGLTLGCARCHNHKFDPVTQKDYYSIQAVFAGVQHGERPLITPSDQRERLADVQRRIAELRRELAALFPNKPALREAVQPKGNVEVFKPLTARFVRFTILQTNSSQPCIDELEIFSGDKNVALASAGAKATSSGDYPNNPLHKLKHINDGQYGNGRSWISNENGRGWVQIELAKPTRIDRIEWARDRQGKYKDRLATKYRIETATEPGKWQRVASSEDRLPFGGGEAPLPSYDFSKLPTKQAEQGRRWLAKLKASLKQRDRLSAVPTVYAGKFQQPGPTHRLYRGEPKAKREEVSPGAIESLGKLDLAKNSPEQQRRLKFAQWVARGDNPLTARVIVNRLWQFQFGTGLVGTPSDFGANGALPSHPRLLDWLAGELVDSGWSLKHIHRTILLSNTWQQDSRPHAASHKVDAACRLLWRFPPRRLEAEAIRDSIVAASGVLDLRMGGPGFSGFEVQMENVRHYFPKKSYGPKDWRRMIYMTKVRQEQESVFGAFDCPDASQVMPRRSRSTTPLQALNLLNSAFVLQQAELFAKRLQREAGTAEDRVPLAYQLCYVRDPSEGELTEASAFVRDHGLKQFCRALLNSNESLFIP